MAKKSAKRKKSAKSTHAVREEVAPAARALGELLRAPDGAIDLSTIDARATPGFVGNKDAGKDAIVALAPRLDDLQERLFANGKSDGTRRVLLVLQGMDTSGKGGILRHVVGMVDPQGVAIRAFKAPTKEELSHEFLWRIRNALPEPGMIGVFDRSQYEDVLVVRVHDLVEKRVWSRRYATINRFEEQLVDSGCSMIKVMLHISPEEQKARLKARLADPTKHWKYNPRDLDERALWPAYQEAYEAAIERCSTAGAPWYVVPADRKWYAKWAVAALLVEHLEAMDLVWPAADFDVKAEKTRLALS